MLRGAKGLARDAYIAQFANYLPAALKVLAKRAAPADVTAAQRLPRIWADRVVFSDHFSRVLFDAVGGKGWGAAGAQTPPQVPPPAQSGHDERHNATVSAPVTPSNLAGASLDDGADAPGSAGGTPSGGGGGGGGGAAAILAGSVAQALEEAQRRFCLGRAAGAALAAIPDEFARGDAAAVRSVERLLAVAAAAAAAHSTEPHAAATATAATAAADDALASLSEALSSAERSARLALSLARLDVKRRGASVERISNAIGELLSSSSSDAALRSPSNLGATATAADDGEGDCDSIARLARLEAAMTSLLAAAAAGMNVRVRRAGVLAAAAGGGLHGPRSIGGVHVQQQQSLLPGAVTLTSSDPGADENSEEGGPAYTPSIPGSLPSPHAFGGVATGGFVGGEGRPLVSSTPGVGGGGGGTPFPLTTPSSSRSAPGSSLAGSGSAHATAATGSAAAVGGDIADPLMAEDWGAGRGGGGLGDGEGGSSDDEGTPGARGSGGGGGGSGGMSHFSMARVASRAAGHAGGSTVELSEPPRKRARQQSSSSTSVGGSGGGDAVGSVGRDQDDGVAPTLGSARGSGVSAAAASLIPSPHQQQPQSQETETEERGLFKFDADAAFTGMVFSAAAGGMVPLEGPAEGEEAWREH